MTTWSGRGRPAAAFVVRVDAPNHAAIQAAARSREVFRRFRFIADLSEACGERKYSLTDDANPFFRPPLSFAVKPHRGHRRRRWSLLSGLAPDEMEGRETG